MPVNMNFIFFYYNDFFMAGLYDKFMFSVWNLTLITVNKFVYT